MGFFLSQQKKTKPVKGLRNAKPTVQNVELLHRLGCRACPLDSANVKSPKLPPSVSGNTLVYFLGTTPDGASDAQAEPLSGPVGNILRSSIPEDQIDNCSFDYIVRDRTPNDREPAWVEVECCRKLITASIEKAKPKLIVGLGVGPLNWAIGSNDINGMRGRMFAIKVGNHACFFMPTFDPAYIQRHAFNKSKPLQSKLGHCFKMDVRKAFRVGAGLKPPSIHTEQDAKANVQIFMGSQGEMEAVLGLLAEARKRPLIGLDVETSTLRPYALNARMLTAAISFTGTTFAFAIDHPKARWTTDQRNKILTELYRLILSDTIKVAHNAPFEIEWFIKLFGPTIVRHDVWECTMMQAHFLDERRGSNASGDDSNNRRATYQSIDFLCKQYFGIAYKKFFKLPKGDMANADLAETLLYNGVDAKYALALYETQRKLLADGGLLEAYYEALPRQATVALMQQIGIYVDQGEINAAQRQLEKEINLLISQIAELDVVKAFKDDNADFNPLSGQDCIRIFRDYLHCKETAITEASGAQRFSTDKGVLDQIDHPLAQLIIDLRNRTKLKSTYIDCFEQGKGAFVWPDGKLHTSFNTTFTVTGRTSSDEPNQQNWPKRNDAWVRRIVVPSKDHVLVAFDYGQLEACTAAMCSRDEKLVKALWDDYDIHMEWTQKLVKKYPALLADGEVLRDKPTAKRYRSLVKNKMVFPAIFGASVSSIAGYLSAPEDKITELMDEFWDSFSGLKKWQDRLMKGYYDHGYVTSLTGRRHNYPLTRNEAINFPVQSVASDIVCQAMNTLSDEAVRTKQWHLHPVLNIHDDLTFIIPDDEDVLEKSIRRIYEVMLTPQYDFINVPMSVECSVGHNWYEMNEIGKFWSHRDLQN